MVGSVSDPKISGPKNINQATKRGLILCGEALPVNAAHPSRSTNPLTGASDVPDEVEGHALVDSTESVGADQKQFADPATLSRCGDRALGPDQEKDRQSAGSQGLVMGRPLGDDQIGLIHPFS